MNEAIFKVFPELTMDEFTLKAISENDMNEINEMCSYRPADRQSTGPELLQKIEDEYLAKNGINWGIYFENKLIGTIGFYRGFENNEAEIGYVLLKQYRGKGITTKAVKLLVRFAFEDMKISKVKAYTAKENLASHYVLEKSSFRKVASDIEDDCKFELILSDLQHL